MNGLLSYVAVRLPIVLPIELIAFLFLRLYKASLLDITYYQNELTNLEMKVGALVVALARDDQELAREVTRPLATTEWNFVLKKDETTIDLEKLRRDKDLTEDARELHLKLIDKIPSNGRGQDEAAGD